jgi:hypothetical protein
VQTLEQLIAQAPVFDGLDPALLAVVAGCARNEHAEAGTLLLRQGESAGRFFLIRRGTVALEVQARRADDRAVRARGVRRRLSARQVRERP